MLDLTDADTALTAGVALGLLVGLVLAWAGCDRRRWTEEAARRNRWARRR